MTSLVDSVERRRTFAIISHPDAGENHAHGEAAFCSAERFSWPARSRRAANNGARASDWMKVERGTRHFRERVGHDLRLRATTRSTCSTPRPSRLQRKIPTARSTAVDSAIMVIDAARGIEEQTLKLFEVCRLRDVPIITFVNKLDREGRDPFDLMDEDRAKAGARRHSRELAIGMGRSVFGLLRSLARSPGAVATD